MKWNERIYMQMHSTHKQLENTDKLYCILLLIINHLLALLNNDKKGSQNPNEKPNNNVNYLLKYLKREETIKL